MPKTPLKHLKIVQPTPIRNDAHKRVSILAVLDKLGHAAVQQAAGGNFYYLSPFTAEKTPSFVACEPKNCWVDFTLPPLPTGRPVGGDAVALLVRLYAITVPQAKTLLLNWSGELPAAPLAPPPPATAVPAEERYDVREETLAFPVLIEYLRSRKINWDLVRRSARTTSHLVQVFYRVGGAARDKPYFALGWRTSAGIELRSRGYQSCHGGKGPTWLRGPRPGVVVFEGFMDYLSCLTMFKVSHFDSTVLVLNSLATLGGVMKELQAAPVVHWWGDNDAAGERALHELQLALPGRVVAHNEWYRGFKDLNDYLTGTLPSKPLPARRAAPSALSRTAKWWVWAVFDKLDEAKSKKLGVPTNQECTFFSWTNDAAGLERLELLIKVHEHGWVYFRLCERTTGRQYKILLFGGVQHDRPTRASNLVAA